MTTSWPVDPYTGRPRVRLDHHEAAVYLEAVTGQPPDRVAAAMARSDGVRLDGREVAAILADLRGWSPADADLLTSAQAAGVLRISAVTFRQWVTRSAALKAGRVFVDRRTPLYPRAVILEHAAARARKVTAPGDD